MTIVLSNDSGDIQKNIQSCTGKNLSQTVSDLTSFSEVLAAGCPFSVSNLEGSVKATYISGSSSISGIIEVIAKTV